MKNLFSTLSKYKISIMAVILVLLTIVLIAVLFVFRNNDDSRACEEEANALSAENMTSAESELLSGDSRIIVVCNGEAPGSVIFISLVEFKVYSERIIVTPLDSETSAQAGTYAECYAYGGINMLRKAVETNRKCKIDRYVIMDKEGFCDIIDEFGKITVNVEEPYTYESSDKNNSVSTGEAELDSSMLYSYMTILTKGSNSEKRLSDLFCVIINSCLGSVQTEDALTLFEDLSNHVNTDITVADYYSCCLDIEHIISSDTICIPYDSGDK